MARGKYVLTPAFADVTAQSHYLIVLTKQNALNDLAAGTEQIEERRKFLNYELDLNSDLLRKNEWRLDSQKKCNSYMTGNCNGNRI